MGLKQRSSSSSAPQRLTVRSILAKDFAEYQSGQKRRTDESRKRPRIQVDSVTLVLLQDASFQDEKDKAKAPKKGSPAKT